ncbi:hypothetical protein Q5P01_013537 [Channa striata]|uniref:Uncharacterized protein n=1 Tax=Channa striata TaxID=64152 RepID=A0AA88MMN8_CHASR|nr:hypothetical protein Q5P01_013537 [Channa striata]
MKTEVTEANRRCGPSINCKLMSQKCQKHILLLENKVLSHDFEQPYAGQTGTESMIHTDLWDNLHPESQLFAM